MVDPTEVAGGGPEEREGAAEAADKGAATDAPQPTAPQPTAPQPTAPQPTAQERAAGPVAQGLAGAGAEEDEEAGGASGSDRPGRRYARFTGRLRRRARPEEPLDYKNVAYLSKMVSPQGRIISRKRTGFSGQDQRKLALAVKQARFLGLLPYIT